jgi:hypothetical protein
MVCGLCADARNSSVFIYLHDITGCDPSNGGTDLCDYKTGFCDSDDSAGEGTAVEADSLGGSFDQVCISHYVNYFPWLDQLLSAEDHVGCSDALGNEDIIELVPERF